MDAWILPLLEHPPAKQDVTQIDLKRRHVTRRIYFEPGPHKITIQEDTKNRTIYYRLGGYGTGNVKSVYDAAEILAAFVARYRDTSKTLWIQAGVWDEERSGQQIAEVEFGGPIVDVDYHSRGWNHFRNFAGANFIELTI